MKYIFFCLCLLGLLLPQFSQAQTKSINKFYKKHKKSEGAQKIKLPGWILDIGVGIGKLGTKTQEERDALKLAKKINQLKILSIDENNPVRNKEVKNLIKKLERKSFEKMISIREGKSRMNLMIREKNGIIKNFIFLLNDPEEFVLISIKSHLSIKKINQLLQKIETDFDFDLELPKDEEEDKNLIL